MLCPLANSEFQLAAVAELADALGSGPSGGKTPWRFDSSQPHFFEAQAGKPDGSETLLSHLRRAGYNVVDLLTAFGLHRRSLLV